MRLGGMRLAALLASLAPLVAWGAEGDEASTRRYTDADGRCSIALPADWQGEVLGRDPDDTEEVLSVRGIDADGEADCVVLVRLGSPCYDERSLFFYRRVLLRLENAEYRIEVLDDPIPHMVVHDGPEEGPRRDVFVSRAAGGTTWQVWLSCRTEHWERLREPLLAAAASLRAETAPPAEPPDGYRTREKGSIVFAWPESFSKRDAADVYGLVDKLVREYERLHGKIREPRAGSRMAYIHPERKDAAPVTEVPTGSSHDPWFCYDTGRLFACTPDAESPGATAALFHATAYLLHAQRYGSVKPAWMAVGESLVIGSYIETGKRLPGVGWLYRNMMPADPLPLDRLSDPTEDIEGRGYQGVAWVAFFRGGPSRYRKAYSDFLEEFDETGDWYTAMEKHLLSLDQEKMRDDLRTFLNDTIKPIHNH